MESFASALKTLGHVDRLRILALLSQGELTVSELVQILDLSQPRVTQYIKTMEAAGILERLKEGSWVFSRLRRNNAGLSAVVASVLSALPKDDPVLQADQGRLDDVRAERSKQAEAFFTDVANDRGQLGHEYLPQADIEAAMLALLPVQDFDYMIDLGTGTGRMLEVFAPHIARGAGVDASVDMLKVARHKLAADAFAHISVQQADLNDTPLADGRADLVPLHQVLHFLDDPVLAIREAARLLAPGGHLLVTDFAPHRLDIYREEYAHRRLGFADAEIESAFADCGFTAVDSRTIVAPNDTTPTIKIWYAVKSAVARPAQKA